MAKITKKLKRTLNHPKKKKRASSLAHHPPQQGILQQALAFHQAGNLPKAEALYGQILQTTPNHPDALSYAGMLAHQTGKVEKALELLTRAIECKPDNVEAYNNLGNVYQAQGKPEEAINCYQRAITLNPNHIQAHYNLGNALRSLNKPEEAIASYRRALAFKPDYVEASYNMGILLQTQGRPAEAEDAFRRVLARQPDFAGAFNNLGFVLQAQDRLSEAEACYRRALALQPHFVEALTNLGNVLYDQGKPEEAEVCYRRVLDLQPDYAEAHTNLGTNLQKQGKLEEAVQCYRRALTLQPDDVEAHNNLGTVFLAQGKMREAMASFRQTLALRPDYAEAHSNLLLCLNYLPDLSPSDYLAEARRYGTTTANKVDAPFSEWRCTSTPDRLCIGLVSGDLCNHSVGYFLENLLTNIDTERIDLIAYPTSRWEDDLTARLRKRFVGWKPIAGVSDATAARLIHEDGVHILFDLAGHTNLNRLPVFAWKPAPIQVSWLGYSASTGLAEMDYILVDPYVAPPGEERHFTETIWRLPESYLCFSPPQVEVAVNNLPVLKEGRFTFGCFNNPTKMNDAVVALWAKILLNVPNSRLFLKSKRFSDPSFCEMTRRRFASFDISSERILLESFVPGRAGHLSAYHRVDLALDPFPYNGTTTSVEGLWMGVPFITRRGDRFVSRVGESIARNIGMADWVAENEEDYVAKATALAGDQGTLAEIRAGLRQRALASPLFDGQRFARNFEKAAWGMWRARHPPQTDR